MIVKTTFLDLAAASAANGRTFLPFMIQLYTEIRNDYGTEGWVMIPHQPMVEWCKEFCSGDFEDLFSQITSTFFFENKEDALYFKTVWGSKDYPTTNQIHWDRSELN